MPCDHDVIYGIISKTNITRFENENNRDYFISLPISFGYAPVKVLQSVLRNGSYTDGDQIFCGMLLFFPVHTPKKLVQKQNPSGYIFSNRAIFVWK
jgi:hypothetical protein